MGEYGPRNGGNGPYIQLRSAYDELGGLREGYNVLSGTGSLPCTCHASTGSEVMTDASCPFGLS